MGRLYLLHWEPPLVGGRQPMHYLGWTSNGVERRVLDHLNNGKNAAKIVVAAVQAGREIRLAAQWPGTRKDESLLKKRNKSFKSLCPICQQEEAE